MRVMICAAAALAVSGSAMAAGTFDFNNDIGVFGASKDFGPFTVGNFKNKNGTAHANGGAVYDGGPDGLALDPDLEGMGLGGILIIQENGQNADPNDKASGGSFTVTFDAPTAFRGLTVVDFNGGTGGSKITLSDGANAVEFTFVGDNFTSDGGPNGFAAINFQQIVAAGAAGLDGPGLGVPNGGFVKLTAGDANIFDWGGVETADFFFNGSGGVDNFIIPLPHGGAMAGLATLGLIARRRRG